MKTSSKGQELIKASESLKLVAYICPAGVPTIGYGTTKGVTKEDVANARKITKAQADKLFKEDLKEFEDAVTKLCRVPPNQHEFDAMVCLTYNIGVGAFAKSSVLRLHNANDKLGASRAFMLWNKAKVKGVSTVLKGLTIRRAKESALYLEPIAGTEDDSESIVSDDKSSGESVQYLIPQDIQEEKPMTDSTINRGAVLAGGTALTTGALDALNTANAFKDSLANLGTYAVPILCVAIVAFCAYTVYQRYEQRKQGIA